MTTTIPNTLLALLLALKNLETPLNGDEEKALAKIGQKLKKDPKDWNFTKKKLMVIIEANQALNQLYQEAKIKLESLDRPIPLNLLPTNAELEKVLPPESKGDTRAHPPYSEGQLDKQSKEILNLYTKVTSTATETPEETAKRLPLERIEKFLDKLFL